MNVGSDRVFTRFIPAGAGNTRLNREGATGTAVYPRWRGEHLPTAKDWKTNLGLSPLARGTLKLAAGMGGTGRFIPAGAGNSFRVDRLLRNRAGLSPLARGTLSFSI